MHNCTFLQCPSYFLSAQQVIHPKYRKQLTYHPSKCSCL